MGTEPVTQDPDRVTVSHVGGEAGSCQVPFLPAKALDQAQVLSLGFPHHSPHPTDSGALC